MGRTRFGSAGPVRVLLAAALLAAVLGAGCGYRLGAPQDLPGGVRTLHIGRVDNPTLDVTLTPLLHALFRQEVNERNLASWADARQADAVMHLAVVNLNTSSRVTNSEGITLKYQVVVTLEGTLVRNADRKTVWESGPVTGEETYFSSVEEVEALRRAMEFAVRRLVDSMTATF